jgi:hypothetical protein
MGVVEKRAVTESTQQKVRDREDALASTRAACSLQTTTCPVRFVPCHPERSEAESKDPAELPKRFTTGFLDFARNDR